MSNTAASTLITRCLDNLSRAGAGTTRSGAELSSKGIDWLNAALRKVANAYDFEELYLEATATTADGTKIYAFPDDYNTVFSLRLIDGNNSYKIERVPARDLDKYVASPENDTEGKPVWYVPYGDSFELYPIPDDAYTLRIRYARVPDTITSSATLIDYLPWRDDIIVAAMTAEGFKMYQMYEDGAFWEGEFKRLLAEQTSDDVTDLDLKGKGFDSTGGQRLRGEYWSDPFVWKG